MKSFSLIIAVCAMVAALLAGCRNRPADTTVPGTRPSTSATTAPTQRPTTLPPQTVPSTVTMPDVTLPQGTDVTPGSTGPAPSRGRMPRHPGGPRP